MSKKIVVAGAGHGGVIAAAKLAKEGFDVTVYEKKKRENIGHDWEDRFDFRTVLDAVEKDEMPDGAWKYRGNTVFVSPSKRTEVKIDFAPDKRQKVMWRKPLINIIIDYAESSGVKFAFENEIISPIIKGNRCRRNLHCERRGFCRFCHRRGGRVFSRTQKPARLVFD